MKIHILELLRKEIKSMGNSQTISSEDEFRSGGVLILMKESQLLINLKKWRISLLVLLKRQKNSKIKLMNSSIRSKINLEEMDSKLSINKYFVLKVYFIF